MSNQRKYYQKTIDQVFENREIWADLEFVHRNQYGGRHTGPCDSPCDLTWPTEMKIRESLVAAVGIISSNLTGPKFRAAAPNIIKISVSSSTCLKDGLLFILITLFEMMGYWTHELQEPVHLIPLNLEISDIFS